MMKTSKLCATCQHKKNKCRVSSSYLCLGVEIDRNKERGSFLGRGVHFFGQGFIFGVRGSTLIFLAFSVD